MTVFGHSASLQTLALAAIVFAVLCVLVYAQFRSAVPWNFWDLIKDDSTHKASIDKSITFVLCCVAIWYVAARSVNAEFDTSGGAGAVLVQVLSIFLVLRGAKTVTQAWKEKAPTPPAEAPQVTAPGATITTQAEPPKRAAVTAAGQPSGRVDVPESER